MHYNSNKKLYVVSLILFILLIGIFIGHTLQSDSFQSILYPSGTFAHN